MRDGLGVRVRGFVGIMKVLRHEPKDPPNIGLAKDLSLLWNVLRFVVADPTAKNNQPYKLPSLMVGVGVVG